MKDTGQAKKGDETSYTMRRMADPAPGWAGRSAENPQSVSWPV